MKKNVLIITLLTSVIGYSQTTMGYFTERTVTATVAPQNTLTDLMTVTEVADPGTDGGMTVLEAQASATGTNYQAYFNFPGSPNQDLSSYDTYHVSLKSTSPDATIIRIEDASGLQGNFDPTNYGFLYDGNWHSIAIPFTDIVAQTPAFDFTDVNNVFFVKSTPGAGGDVVPATYLFYVDDVYFSSGVVLSTPSFEEAEIGFYPNPAKSVVTLKTTNRIDTVIIYNLTGQKVLESAEFENINITSLDSGMYLVNAVLKGTVIASMKLIKT